MIRISFKYDADGVPIAFRMDGHAGFARKGKDIVCAAVSVLAINTVNSVEALTDDRFTLDTDEERGFMQFSFNTVPSGGSKILMKSLEIGIKGIVEDSNNNRFINLVEWEV